MHYKEAINQVSVTHALILRLHKENANDGLTEAWKGNKIWTHALKNKDVYVIQKSAVTSTILLSEEDLVAYTLMNKGSIVLSMPIDEYKLYMQRERKYYIKSVSDASKTSVLLQEVMDMACLDSIARNADGMVSKW